MQTLQRHYDVVSTIGTAGVFLIVGAPWLLWATWGALAAYQVQHIARRRQHADA